MYYILCRLRFKLWGCVGRELNKITIQHYTACVISMPQIGADYATSFPFWSYQFIQILDSLTFQSKIKLQLFFSFFFLLFHSMVILRGSSGVIGEKNRNTFFCINCFCNVSKIYPQKDFLIFQVFKNELELLWSLSLFFFYQAENVEKITKIITLLFKIVP